MSDRVILGGDIEFEDSWSSGCSMLLAAMILAVFWLLRR